MYNPARLIKLVFGVCVILVTVVSSGCAVTPMRQPMRMVDLDTFRVNCRMKGEQVAMLQQMRLSGDDLLLAKLGNITKPWTMFSNSEQYDARVEMGSGRTNWMIDQLLLELRECP